MPKNNENGGRVSTQQFYKALLKQNDRMDNMERRILERVDRGIEMQRDYQQQTDARLAAATVHLEEVDKDIDGLKKWDRGIGLLSVVGSVIASIIGLDQK